MVICVSSSITVAPCPAGNAPELQALPDAAIGAQFFDFYFCFVMALWMIAKACGLLLSAVRKW